MTSKSHKKKPTYKSYESLNKISKLYQMQLYKWELFHDLVYHIRTFDKYDSEGGFEDGRDMWNKMSKLNDDFSFFKYPNIINWYRYVDCIITESEDPPKKDDKLLDDFKRGLQEKGFKIA